MSLGFKRVNEFIKDLTILSVLSGVLSLIKFFSLFSKFVKSKHLKKEVHEEVL